ncbi:hypothetical protein [Streptomyces sp. NBC_00103]|uniref:hypothetical protein n=1 Tax=Streptomyces sp. NBC_00103 TaxID=2975653 RepID=UPI0022583E3C|nr:hypothetical protein [Streptomyces sp. NBC_00103]MCX5373244.1 hypothetical protein [Streptomyces sp. NBC_00103]
MTLWQAQGIQPALYLGATVGLLHQLIATYRFEIYKDPWNWARAGRETFRMRVGRPYDKEVLYRSGYQSFISVSSATVAGAAFCLAFALFDANIRLDYRLDQVYSQELSDGSLILRISTVFFTLAVLGRSFQHLKLGSRSLRLRDWSSEAKLRRMRRYDAQSSLFVGALCLLWLLNANGVENRWTTVLAFAFAFFCDDWMIISDYARELDQSPMATHKLRIRAAYILLFAPLSVIVWQEWHWKGSFALLYFAISVLGARSANRKIQAGVERQLSGAERRPLHPR